MLTIKVNAIDTDARLYVKKIFPEGYIVFELKILLELFGFKYEFFLEKIGKKRKHRNATSNIPDKGGQFGLV